MYRALGAYTIIIIVICDNVFFLFWAYYGNKLLAKWRSGVSVRCSFIYIFDFAF